MVDISLKGGNGIELIPQLRKLNQDMKAVVFSLHDEAAYIDAAKKAGAHGYMIKGDSPQAMIKCLRIINAGQTQFSKPHSP